MNPVKKPFKLVSNDRKTRKGVVAGSLEELTTKGTPAQSVVFFCVKPKQFSLFLNKLADSMNDYNC